MPNLFSPPGQLALKYCCCSSRSSPSRRVTSVEAWATGRAGMGEWRWCELLVSEDWSGLDGTKSGGGGGEGKWSVT